MNKKLVFVTVCILILFQACASPSPAPVVEPTKTATLVPPTPTSTPTATPTSVPTPIPLAWKQIYNGQEFAYDEIKQISQDSRNSALLFINTGAAGIYESNDGGRSWKPALNTTSMPLPANPSLPDGLKLPGDCSAHAVDPVNKSIVYCGLEKGIYFTTNGGKTWELVHPRVGWVKTILISPHDRQVVFAGGQGFSISKDGGYTWKQFNDGLPKTPLELKINPKDQTILFAQDMAVKWTASGTQIYRSADGGRTWGQTTKNNCSLMFDAGGNSICGYKKSTDGGRTWIDAPKPISQYQSSIGSNYPFSSTMILITFFSEDGVLVSQDKGRTWRQTTGLQRDPEITRFFFDHAQGQTIYALTSMDRGENLEIYRSNDFGKTWRPCPSSQASTSQTDPRLAIDYEDQNHLLLASQGRGILVSANGCASWRESNTGLGNLYVNTISADPNNPNTFYAGTNGGAYVSFDGGATWGQVNNGLIGSDIIYSIVVDNESNVYAATPYGVFKLESR
jgi:photosystem II stability/assembly factor-like uncharacterized protein